MVLSVGISNTDIVVGALVCILLFLGTRSTRIPRGASLPPGPPGKAIVGNFSDIPEAHEWETYAHWAKKYGKIVQPIVYINSAAAAQELFEKRSSIYSDRFGFPMLIDLILFDWNFVAMRYGDRWRRHRKMFHQKLHPTPVGAYHSIQHKHTLRQILEIHGGAIVLGTSGRPGVEDPSAAFGFGPDNTIYIATSTILKLFNISRAKEANGREIPINVTFTSRTILRPDPFECSITPGIGSSESLLEHYQGLWGDEL
ncbi:cytochrome P450 [Gautieria morchelliformis]|nr:cytochrome P450 [Gautieria morchelliformis]